MILDLWLCGPQLMLVCARCSAKVSQDDPSAPAGATGKEIICEWLKSWPTCTSRLRSKEELWLRRDNPRRRICIVPVDIECSSAYFLLRSRVDCIIVAKIRFRGSCVAIQFGPKLSDQARSFTWLELYCCERLDSTSIHLDVHCPFSIGPRHAMFVFGGLPLSVQERG
jgi:hypothetical protein